MRADFMKAKMILQYIDHIAIFSITKSFSKEFSDIFKDSNKTIGTRWYLNSGSKLSLIEIITMPPQNKVKIEIKNKMLYVFTTYNDFAPLNLWKK